LKNYMNRIDREHHLFMLVAWDFLSRWLEKTSCLSKDERKRVKTATTHLLHTSDSIIARLETDYAKKLLRDVKNTEIRILDKQNAKLGGLERTINVDIDDLYDIASYALVDCKCCSKENHKECEKYKLFMELNIPVAQEQTDGCPYEN